MTTDLTERELTPRLSTQALGRHAVFLETVDSTNTVAMQRAHEGAVHGTLVVANHQTAGRGRLGRTWISPPHSNLYASAVLRYTIPASTLAEWLSWVPLLTAMGLADAIEQVTGVVVGLKWPNDLFIHDRKLGGILCESGGRERGAPHVIVGFGLNVNVTQADFPADLQTLATSLHLETGRTWDRPQLLAAILIHLEQTYTVFLEEDRASLLTRYQQRCVSLGRRVQVLYANGDSFTGVAQAISPDGALQVLRSEPLGAEPSPLVEVRAGDILHLR
jgi:BirA family biotin operon repressor/biotin-[acetyl-CoA-carboxylase] ligase